MYPFLIRALFLGDIAKFTFLPGINYIVFLLQGDLLLQNMSKGTPLKI